MAEEKLGMRLLRCLVGSYAGQLIEYDEHVSDALLSTGQAELVTAEDEAVFRGRVVEVAIVPAGETTEKPRRKKKG